MPLKSTDGLQPPDTFRLAYLRRTHKCAYFWGAAKRASSWGGWGQCWNQPHERITNYCPLGHAQYWRREGRAWLDGPAAGGFRGWVVLEVSVWSNTIKAILKGNTKWSLPPFPSTSLPLWPGLLLSFSSSSSSALPLPLFLQTQSAKRWTRCILYDCFMYFKHQTDQIFYDPLLFSSTSPSFHSLDSTSLSIYKSLNRSDQQGTGNPVKIQEKKRVDHMRDGVTSGTKVLGEVHSSAHYLQICWRNELWGKWYATGSWRATGWKQTEQQNRRCFHPYANLAGNKLDA